MKTKFTIYKQLGSLTNTDSEKAAIETFNKYLESTSVINNKTGEVLISREHKRCGTLRTGIKFIGNIKIFECSDTSDKITILGEKLKSAITRFSVIRDNRQFDTFYAKQ